jgi:L-ascorbate metabolism protein UlaG (beta-lactamase superfamily)
VNLLVDPVFADRIGWIYPRHGAPGLTPSQLPRIDVLLITHSHYDHLDRASIEALPRGATVVCGRRLGPWFVKRNFARVIELDWWESVELGAAHVTFVPARHWSKRSLFDTNYTLWGGFVVSGGGTAIYAAGDTAWFDGFAEIGQRFPYLDAALIPIGGYEPAWFMDQNHLNPEQAGQAFLACGARSLGPSHWGAFQVTDEPLREPIERLRRWWSTDGPDDHRNLLELRVGETAPVSAQAPNSALSVVERGLV